jgi:hypothetical protein
MDADNAQRFIENPGGYLTLVAAVPCEFWVGRTWSRDLFAQMAAVSVAWRVCTGVRIGWLETTTVRHYCGIIAQTSVPHPRSHQHHCQVVVPPAFH